jgi:hypothetical protein
MFRIATLASFLAAAASALAQGPLTTAFTYQGELRSSGSPVSGLYDLRFRLYDSPTAGTQLGSMICADNTLLSGGRFTLALDFGAQFAGQQRYIEIDVRQDTGLTCSSASGFTTLSPRQALTAAPNAAFALDSGQLNGQPASFFTSAANLSSGILPDARLSSNVPRLNTVNAFGPFTNSFLGNVGIGTATPGMRLTVAGDMELGTSSGDYRRFRIGGGNSDGFLYGSYPALGDGIHMGYNWYYDAAGTGHIVNAGGGTSRVTVGYGAVVLATGNVGQVPANRLVVESGGNVRIGPGTAYYVPAGEENLRIIRGVVNASGGIIVGSGFAVSHPSLGHYTITFNTPFSGAPAVTATADAGVSAGIIVATQGATSNWVNLDTAQPLTTSYVDAPIHFIAVGPR